MVLYVHVRSTYGTAGAEAHLHDGECVIEIYFYFELDLAPLCSTLVEGCVPCYSSYLLLRHEAISVAVPTVYHLNMISHFSSFLFHISSFALLSTTLHFPLRSKWLHPGSLMICLVLILIAGLHQSLSAEAPFS